MIYNVQQAADFSASELMLTIWIIHESTEKMTNIHIHYTYIVPVPGIINLKKYKIYHTNVCILEMLVQVVLS